MVIGFLYNVVVVFGARFDFFPEQNSFSMPKVNKLSTKRSAVLARKRREKEKEDNNYNATLKEYVEAKYSHIIAEFNPFYEDLKAKHPPNMIYTNTNEFCLWRKSQIEKSFSTDNLQIAYFDKQDLYEASGCEQHDEQHEQQSDEQHEQQSEQQSDEQHEQQSEQQSDEQHEQQSEQQSDEQHGDDEQQQQGEQRNELGLLVNEIIGELDDEGIDLDLYEELQADIADFDYRLEVELEGDMW